MGEGAVKKRPDLTASPQDYFLEVLEHAFQHLKLEASPLSKTYLVGLLQFYMFAKNLFTVDEKTGRYKRETLAELYLKSQNLPPTQKMELLKKLGDTSLYISGFFGDSLNRKVVDIDYYAEMGGTAYDSLARITGEIVYKDLSQRFLGFVDALTYVSQQASLQSNGDLLRLYDRYVSTGSKLAEEQLREKGMLHSDLNKIKRNKQ
jgi:hypothetical protein